MKRHTGERKHVCEECGRGFIQATQLKKHSNVHVRPFKCAFCDESFKSEKQYDFEYLSFHLINYIILQINKSFKGTFKSKEKCIKREKLAIVRMPNMQLKF